MYNPKSLKAEEFISHEEIQESLAFADANKKLDPTPYPGFVLSLVGMFPALSLPVSGVLYLKYSPWAVYDAVGSCP